MYGSIEDLVKAFDSVHRRGLVFRLNAIGVIGRNLRLMHDDMQSTFAEIVYEWRTKSYI